MQPTGPALAAALRAAPEGAHLLWQHPEGTDYARLVLAAVRHLAEQGAELAPLPLAWHRLTSNLYALQWEGRVLYYGMDVERLRTSLDAPAEPYGLHPIADRLDFVPVRVDQKEGRSFTHFLLA